MANAVPSNNPRIRYHEGQLLAARDLQDERAYEDWLRRLHTRVLHDTWGITLGFNVVAAFEVSRILVTPGLAYDCWGRELVLVEMLEIPIPKDWPAEGLVLAIRYNEMQGTDQQTIPNCAPSQGLDPALERPILFWQSLNQLHLGEDLPLALIRLNNKRPELDLGIRRYAQTLQRPHIGWDTFEVTITSEQEWAPYLWKLSGEDNPVGFQFEIDTSEAGFSQTPFYFATSQVATNVPEFDLILNTSFQSIADPAPDKFTFRLLFLPEQGRLNRRGSRLMEATGAGGESQIKITIFWTGLELVTGCEPILDRERAFTVGGDRLLNWQNRWLPQLMAGMGNSGSFFGGGQ